MIYTHFLDCQKDRILLWGMGRMCMNTVIIVRDLHQICTSRFKVRSAATHIIVETLISKFQSMTTDHLPWFPSHPLSSFLYVHRLLLFIHTSCCTSSARNKHLRPLEWMQHPRRPAPLPCVLCAHGGMAARWWETVEIVLNVLEEPRAEEKVWYIPHSESVVLCQVISAALPYALCTQGWGVPVRRAHSD